MTSWPSFLCLLPLLPHSRCAARHTGRRQGRAGRRRPADTRRQQDRAQIAPSTIDAHVLTLLKAAGAIVLGKAHTTEFAYFDGPPPTRNPHNVAHTPGGSSAGPAAVIASGMVPLSLGTQTAGSVSRPRPIAGCRRARALARTEHRSGGRLRGRGRPRHRKCLRYPYRRFRRAVWRSDRTHLGQLPFGRQSPSALRHAGRELGEKILLLAEMPSANSLLAIGYLEAVVAQEALDAEVARLCDRLRGHAPLTMAATRETLRRLAHAPEVDISCLIRACYGSADFRRGAAAFSAGTRIDWEGR